MKKWGLHRKWWFWVVLPFALYALWYIEGYIEWYASGAKYRALNANAQAYMKSQEKQQATLEAAYKNDPYGGATPEETLKLFIAALEQKNYKLASNYFIPEKVTEELAKFPQAERSGGAAGLVNAYANGKVKSVKYEGEQKYEFDLYEPKDSTPFRVNILQNPLTKKWLISEL